MANENARTLRKNLTDAERHLWRHLRELRESHHLHFRKQTPIGAYIVDFCCHAARLIIEVDGGQHNDDNAVIYDAERSRWLEGQGYRVLRFWNNDVLQNIEGVMQAIFSTHTNPTRPAEGRPLNDARLPRAHPPHKGEGL